MRFSNTTRARWRWQLAVALVAATAVSLAYAGQVAAVPKAGAPVFSAAELADGLLFDDGPTARYLTTLDRPPVERTEESVRVQKAHAEAIDKDTRFGATFAKQFQSGDPVQIQSALTDLMTLSRGVMDRLYGKDVMEKALSEATNGNGAGLGIVLHRWIIVYKYIMIVRHFAVVWTRDSVKDFGSNPTLVDELTVRTIAERLHVRG